MGFSKQPTAGRAGAVDVGPKRGWFVASRATLWLFWALSTLVSSAFAVLALTSFAQLRRVEGSIGDMIRELHGPMAAQIFGAVAVVFTNMMALSTLLWKSAGRHGTGFGYGCVVTTYGNSGLWLILSGLVMWAGNEKPLWQTSGHWGHRVSVAYFVTFILAWVTAGSYLLMCAMLFYFRRTFSQPATVVGDTETAMTTAYPAAHTYTSPAYANSPRAAAPSKGWFARKPNPTTAPLAAGAPVAAATATNGTTSHPTTAVTGSNTHGPAGSLEPHTSTDRLLGPANMVPSHSTTDIRGATVI